MKSKLTKNQTKTFTKNGVRYNGDKADIILNIRYDDKCGNGHNTFTMTAEIYKSGRRSDSAWLVGGCCHDEIAKHFPEYANLIKWHLCSSDGPMHYIANTLYHAEQISKHQGQWFVYIDNPDLGIKETLLGILDDETLERVKIDFVDIKKGYRVKQKEHFNPAAKKADLKAARNSAVWENAQLNQFTKEKLEARLPALLKAFKTDVESIDFTF